jgi:ubiquinone/menaquinone biosynthesis C-methylase UbiE
MSAQSHTSDPHLLNQRSLEQDHARLAEWLQPEMSVLDVGCGTGAITAGIARRVRHATGIDRDPALLAIAQSAHGLANLRFVEADILQYDAEERYDIVTAARVLQWIADPLIALRRMRTLTKAGGLVVVLDYNHALHRWDPSPGEPFQAFYQAFLAWRSAQGWDNEMGNHLPALFEAAGLKDIRSTIEDTAASADLWPVVIEGIGPRMVASGVLDESSRTAALAAVRAYCGLADMSLRCVVGMAG